MLGITTALHTSSCCVVVFENTGGQQGQLPSMLSDAVPWI